VIIDSHQHFWNPERFSYFWMEGEAVAPLRRPFLPADLAPLMRDAGVDATVLVQALMDVDETRWFLELANTTPWIAGVVGWVNLLDPRVGETLAGLTSRDDGDYLVGIRHMVQDEPDPNWLLQPQAIAGIREVGAQGLVYDLLLRPPQIAAGVKVSAQLPEVRFVVDHLAKPPIASGEIAAWARDMAPFAEMPHVWCKLSGMVTEANWQTWTVDDLVPYVAKVVEWFGEERLLFGSDWPVCTLAADYGAVKSAAERALDIVWGGELSSTARARIFGGNALEVYRLPIVAE